MIIIKEDDSPPHLKKGLLFLVILLLLLNPVSALNGAYGIKVTKDYIHVDGAKCSCSLSDGYHYHHNTTFKNQCPNCGGKLYYECKSYWIEGIWVCSKCDMDFCLVHGKSHDHRGYYLTKYSIPKIENNTPKVEEKHYESQDAFGRPVKIKLKTIQEVADLL